MKARRHFAITALLSAERIATQEELCTRLRAQGFTITQATVSRDIKELGLVKTSDEAGYYYVLSGQPGRGNTQERMKRLFSSQVLGINYSDNMVVIKTTPGAAQSVGLLIDSLNNPYIIGSVGGDDAILVVVKPRRMTEAVVQYFQSFL
jgi:transcriptional regulator of arginine metabolism